MSFMHETDADAAATLLLLPETAETLLNESINEISRKLIETCGNEMSNDFLEVPHSACFSTCSDFSNDSGVEINNLHNNKRNNSSTNNLINCDELIFNFDNLHMNEAQQQEEVQQYHTLSKLASTMENFLMHLNTNNNSNYNTHTTDENNNDCYTSINIKNTNSNTTEQKHNQQFVKNCLNLVWPNGNEEVREPPITAMLNSLLEVNKTAFSSAASAL